MACLSLNRGFDNKLTEEVEVDKSLGLQIASKLNWKKHTEYTIPKLSSAFFVMKTVTIHDNRCFKIGLINLGGHGSVVG
jgi:hypothetical protein